MSRFVHLAVSYATVVGYFLAITWGPAWHDHHQGCCHSHVCSIEQTSDHSHSHCCSHRHASCSTKPETVEEKSSEHSPCPAPCHDEDCIVCQTLAHPPLSTPTITVVAASEPVPGWVMRLCPEAVVSLPAAYDSRGPPLV